MTSYLLLTKLCMIHNTDGPQLSWSFSGYGGKRDIQRAVVFLGRLDELPTTFLPPEPAGATIAGLGTA